MAKIKMPKSAEVEDLLSSLLGREVTVGEAEALNPKDTPCAFASYRVDGGELVAVGMSDLSFAAYAGACLAMLPADSASEMLKDGDLSAGVVENAGEVFNILCVSLAKSDGPPVRLGDVVMKSDAAADDVVALVGESGKSVTLEVTIDGYGSGVLSLLAP